MVLFRREFRRGLKAAAVWWAVMAGLIWVTMSVYGQFAEQQENLKKLLSTYPDSVKAVFGMDRVDMTTPIGFYAVEVYFMVALLGAVYAVTVAGPMLVKEENDKTAEFLLAKPISRTAVVTEKLLAVGVHLVLFDVAAAVASIVGFRIAGGGWDAESLFLLMLGAWLLHATFAAVAFLLSAALRKSRHIVSASMAVVFVTYFLGVVSDLSEDLKALRYVSPFEYVDAADLLAGRSIDAAAVAVLGAVSIGCMALAYFRYRRKDIAA